MTAVNKAVDDLTQIIQTFAQNVDERFYKFVADVNDLKSDVADCNTKYDHLVPRLISS